MSRVWNVLFWSVISAAFIGPGTVTTAATAGVRFDFALLWALLFSTIACLVLQEAAARITVASGDDLGAALRRTRGGWIAKLAAVAIVSGCAAYEAGNILGGVSGASLMSSLPRPVLTAAIVAAAALLLWFSSARWIARALGLVVAVMGIVFAIAAVRLAPSLGALLKGSLMPTLPTGSLALVLGLVGTTVVPYNLFLGSGLAKGQKLGELRFGLSVAVILGGLISMTVLIVGSALEGQLEFAKLAQILEERIGTGGGIFLALGLFAAGLSSAITAPLAAAIASRSLLASSEDRKWTEQSIRYRAVWLGVLTMGLIFGLSGVRPIPIIILAQVLNGLILPFVAVFLMVAVNDRALMGSSAINSRRLNLIMAAVVAVSLLLGLSGLIRGAASALAVSPPGPVALLWTSAAMTLLLAVPVARLIRRVHSSGD